MPGSPRLRNGAATPGDIYGHVDGGDARSLDHRLQGRSDLARSQGRRRQLSFPVGLEGSSGASTPGNGARILSERDLRRADEALEKVNGVY
ncbi:hypothetical protein FRC04_006050 [Tulasnella sp. 424]|nr:hypothetical protein FRC04_006050 [Tulasnella sp. 424]